MRSVSVLFVCLGNICRSPLAEAALRAQAGEAGADLTVDSAGTGSWHIGNPPDPRAIAEAARHGVDIGHYRARQVEQADFSRFDRIVALDSTNLRDLRRLCPASASARLSLLLDHVAGREGQDVADPYFGEADGFAQTWRDVTLGAQGLLADLSRSQP